ncbi:MAG TPA: 4-hydroxythreonine-4-phosphate dehydrogenase PdxA [Lacipirellulaceae bacterium]|nr:4-hydroxythreonine-4-phosphate dehydrogenase PdxA [Lacipirellulaceae bacterium]
MNSISEPPTIAVSIGDPAGIGPEVCVKALTDASVFQSARWILVGDAWVIEELENEVHKVPHQTVQSSAELNGAARCSILSPGSIDRSQRTLGKVSAACGQAGLSYVRMAAELCLSGHADAMVTAPLNKESVARTGQVFSGHTEFIAELCGIDESRMMLVNDRLSVVHVTTHISLSDATNLNPTRIATTINLAEDAYRRLRGRKPCIAVCGLNPHAGEHGLFGDQESRIISPVIAEARTRGIDCSGPHPADTLFLQAFRGQYDVVVAMYHDQGHIPMKLMDFEHTVNVTLGLPIVRTSVDHGTAFDIAGKNEASAEDMKAAIQLAIKLARRDENRST